MSYALKLVAQYLLIKHVTILHAYRTVLNTSAENSCSIACDIARKLLRENLHPVLLRIDREVLPNDNNHTLVPRLYEGRKTWGTYWVCECNGIVYDPLIGFPTKLDLYAHAAFDCPVKIQAGITAEQVPEFVHTRRRVKRKLANCLSR